MKIYTYTMKTKYKSLVKYRCEGSKELISRAAVMGIMRDNKVEFVTPRSNMAEKAIINTIYKFVETYDTLPKITFQELSRTHILKFIIGKVTL